MLVQYHRPRHREEVQSNKSVRNHINVFIYLDKSWYDMIQAIVLMVFMPTNTLILSLKQTIFSHFMHITKHYFGAYFEI